MYDELIDENAFTKLSNQKQTELITHYCSDFKNAITQAKTLSEADQYAAEHCRKFELLCTSTMIRTAMRKYVHDIVNERWTAYGH